jgi:hypothetical protein
LARILARRARVPNLAHPPDRVTELAGGVLDTKPRLDDHQPPVGGAGALSRTIFCLAAAIGAAALVGAPAMAAGGDGAYSARYCSPAPGSKLLYSDRAYLILDTPKGASPLEYSYEILHKKERVKRVGQLLSDEGDASAADPAALARLWPLQPGNKIGFHTRREDRSVVEVSLNVLGIDVVETPGHSYTSWKILRTERDDRGRRVTQTLWYAPELCALAAFTSSKNKVIRLVRVLHPGDPGYDRPLDRVKGKLVYADDGAAVD